MGAGQAPSAAARPDDQAVRDGLLAAARRRHEQWQADEGSVPTAAERDRALLLAELGRATDERDNERALTDAYKHNFKLAYLERDRFQARTYALEAGIRAYLDAEGREDERAARDRLRSLADDDGDSTAVQI